MRALIRWTSFLHRYLGIALCVPMLMWCLSGIVMMYVPYPSLSQSAQWAGLAPVDWRGCCFLPPKLPADFMIEMMDGKPLLLGGGAAFDLRTGQRLAPVTPDVARGVALAFARGNAIQSGNIVIDKIQRDQWTVSGEFRRDRPLYRVHLGDTADTWLYISGATGQVVQSVTGSERFWNYLGAVPHWIYFTGLRAQPVLWAQIVIWTSLAGCFLTAFGLYVGIRQWLLARRADRWSPYHGIGWWHHVPGLVFGVFLLSWVLSGLLSMNPWGLLEDDSDKPEIAALAGALLAPAAVSEAIATLRAAPTHYVSLRAAPLAGKLYFIATDFGGARYRLDAHGQVARLTASDRAFIARTLAGNTREQLSLLPNGDNYYFRHGADNPPLPIWRIKNAQGDRYYIDPVSGLIVADFTAADRGYRWLFQGLHRLDFTEWLRVRPLWDIVMLVLLGGASFIAGSGLVMAARHLAVLANGGSKGLR